MKEVDNGIFPIKKVDKKLVTNLGPKCVDFIIFESTKEKLASLCKIKIYWVN